MAEPTEAPDDGLDLASILGSDGGVSTQCITLYIPNKDQDGKEIPNHGAWVLEARQLLTEINRGSTALPPVGGTWLNARDEPIWEDTVIVYSFILPDPFEAGLPRLREFLHRFGRETNQGEVVFEFDGRFYRIKSYDPPPSEAQS